MSRAPETTHKIMSAIKSRDTRPELALRKELWRRGLRYRKNYKRLPGKPDIVFLGVRLAVFCDGDFWHGHNWAIRGYGSLEEELRRYSKAWAVAPAALLPGLAMENGSVTVDRQMATNLPGVFAAGDCTGAPYQVAKAVGEGLIAGQSAAKWADRQG